MNKVFTGRLLIHLISRPSIEDDKGIIMKMRGATFIHFQLKLERRIVE